MRIVIKLGTSTLTKGTPYHAPPLFIELARQISQLVSSGHQVLLVSSGAIAMGREKLGFPQLPKDIPAKQMLAAVGQPPLPEGNGSCRTYKKLFRSSGYSGPVRQERSTGEECEFC